MLNNQLLAANIREAREALRLTQTDVAARLYVTPQTVSKWENGVASPDLSNLCSLVLASANESDTNQCNPYSDILKILHMLSGHSHTPSDLSTIL